MSIPGLDWGVDEVMGKETKKVPQKKVPYAKPIPAQFQQVLEDLLPDVPAVVLSWVNGNRVRNDEPFPFALQAWAENKVPMMPPGGDLAKDRKVEQKVDMKKKTQAEIEQEMAALQYTNPMLLEVSPAVPGGTGTGTQAGLFWLLLPANEDGSDEPDELRREREPPPGPGPALVLLCLRGPGSPRPARVSPQHAAHGSWEYAAPLHAPRTDGASLRPPPGHDGTTRHARTSRYAEAFWPSQEHGSTGAPWHGPQRNAGTPILTRDGSERRAGTSTSGGHDVTSGEHDSSRWDDGAPEQDTRQHVE